MSDYSLILVDNRGEGVQRVTLNRPDERSALSNELRGEIFADYRTKR